MRYQVLKNKKNDLLETIYNSLGYQQRVPSQIASKLLKLKVLRNNKLKHVLVNYKFEK